MALSQRTQRFERLARLLSLGLLVLLVVSIGSTYLPFSLLREAQQQLAERQQQLEQARQAPQQLRQLQQQYENAQRELRFLEQGVSQAAYIPTMLKQIEQTGQQLNLKIIAIRPQQNNPTNQTGQNQQNPSNQQASNQPSPPKAYEEQIIEINLQGRFWSLMSFLKQLDEFPKILAVQTLNAQTKLKPEQENTNPELEIRMTVKAFIFSQSAGLPRSAPSSAPGMSNTLTGRQEYGKTQ
ncbi:MAG: type 4a pilus biogenesis protein PilO [Armatimonadota bacterium]